MIKCICFLLLSISFYSASPQPVAYSPSEIMLLSAEYIYGSNLAVREEGGYKCRIEFYYPQEISGDENYFFYPDYFLFM